MNTFAATMPAPRPTEAVAPRGGGDAVEVPREGAAEAFGAVLGALKEGRPTMDAARRDAETADDAAARAGPAPAEPANPLLTLVVSVDAGALPPAAALDPAALLALIARAAPAGAAAPPSGPTAPEQALSRGAPVPAGVAALAAGIVRAAGENGLSAQVAPGPGLLPQGLLSQAVPSQAVPSQAVPSQAVPPQAGPGPGGAAETRPQVTVLQQETHFAPVKPRLVSGQAITNQAITNQAVTNQAAAIPVAVASPAVPASIEPASIQPARAAAGTETPLDGAAPPTVILGEAPAQAAAAQTQAGGPVTAVGSPRTPAPEPSGKPRRAESGPATAETAVASPTAQRIAGQAAPVEAAGPSPGEVPTAEAGPSEAIAPAPAPGGTPPSAAPLGAPARQVAEMVAAELSRPSATANATPVGEGPLRLLTIQLRPMDLGTVLVRMRLRDGQLEMSLHASREETAALLRQDGALLSDLLRQSGYQPDSVTIGANAAGGAPQGDGGRQSSGAPFQPGGQGGGQAHTGANPDQASRRPGDLPADERSDLTSERTHETTNASGPDRSGLYL